MILYTNLAEAESIDAKSKCSNQRCQEHQDRQSLDCIPIISASSSVENDSPTSPSDVRVTKMNDGTEAFIEHEA